MDNNSILPEKKFAQLVCSKCNSPRTFMVDFSNNRDMAFMLSSSKFLCRKCFQMDYLDSEIVKGLTEDKSTPIFIMEKFGISAEEFTKRVETMVDARVLFVSNETMESF